MHIHEGQAALQRGLMELQARTDERLGELAFAQRKTEQALTKLATSHEELAASHKELAASHKELAASHKELAHGQTLLQKGLSDLAQAQRSTDERLQELARTMNSGFGKIYKMMGETVEEIARYVVPHYLEHEEGILVDRLEVQFFTIGESHFEVDLTGDGRRGNEEILVLCEAKRTVDVRDVEYFHEKAKDVAEATGRKVFPVMFGPRCPWRAHPRARELGVLLVPWDYYMSGGRCS
ncbi:MAG: hypothetical protein HY720_21740 [Planctomycetes bacterium]|nr:hypothetical protein [Planctomycetota bacterium]